jgi:hypothetical protein
MFRDSLVAMYAELGIPPPEEKVPAADFAPPWARGYVKPKKAAVFPTEPDIDEEVVRRASHTRTRLGKVGSNWAGVLLASYGPASTRWARDSHGNPDHPANILGGPHLAEIAVAVLEAARQDGDPGGRTLLWARAADKAAAADLRAQAETYFNSANAAYLTTRCERLWSRAGPCRRCWES